MPSCLFWPPCMTQGHKVVGMFCVTLTVVKNISNIQADQIMDRLVESLTVSPESGGGAASNFQEISGRQLQGWFTSAEEVVGFILSAARSGSWRVHLTAVPDKGQACEYDRVYREPEALIGKRAQTLESLDASRSPGGVQVTMAQGRSLVDSGTVPALGLIEAGMQLLGSIERRRSDEGQEAGLLVNAGASQRATADHLGVSQQAVSSRLQAGYWYESRQVAYWLAHQLSEIVSH